MNRTSYRNAYIIGGVISASLLAAACSNPNPTPSEQPEVPGFQFGEVNCNDREVRETAPECTLLEAEIVEEAEVFSLDQNPS